MIARLAECTGLPLAAAGGPDPGDAAALATAAACEASLPAVSDLRHAVATLDADSVAAVLVAARGGLEADERAALRSASVPVISFEPRPARISDVGGEFTAPEPGRVPRLGESPAWTAATEAIEEFGRIRVLDVAVHGRPEEGSLHARLHDAMDIIERLAGEAAGVAAAVDGPSTDLPEHLAGLRGGIAARIRGEDAWCASVVASDAAPAWNRRVTAIGPNGRFDLDDDGFVWIDPDGAVRERLAAPPLTGDRTGDASPRPIGGTERLADLVSRCVEGSAPPAGASAERRIRRFALSEAALLSARTRESEDPRRIARLLET